MLFTSPSSAPRKKSHRGKRGSGKGHGDPNDHLKNCTDCHGKGDHVNARRHAFAFVRALDAKHGGPTPTEKAPTVTRPAAARAFVSDPPAAPAAASEKKANPTRLLAALKASRKSA